MNYEEFVAKFQKVDVVEHPNNVPKNVKVSVCVQTYNHGSFIAKCLESILNQKTDFDFEILLGEDDSTDETRKLCIKYANENPTIVKLFLHNRENNINVKGKPTGRFNFSNNLYRSNGDFIAFCEGDDYWNDESKLQKQFDFLNNNSNFVCCGHDTEVIIDNEVVEDSLLNFYKIKKHTYTKEELKRGVTVLPLTTFSMNVFEHIPIRFFEVLNADNFLFAYLGNFGDYKLLNEQIKPSTYRKHVGGIWSLTSEKYKLDSKLDTTIIMAKHFEEANDNEVANHYYMSALKLIINRMSPLRLKSSINLIAYLLKRWFLK